MQLEISRLRTQLTSQTSDTTTHSTQLSALQSSLATAETKLKTTENELADTKKALHRASEKSVQDGTNATSKDTKIRTLERDLETTTTKYHEATANVTKLEAKINAMNKLHREAEARTAAKLSSAESTAREIPVLRTKIATLEAETARLREKHKRAISGSGADVDDGLDELEDEGRKKLERRIRELEGQVFDLQRGVWRDQRTNLQPELHNTDGASSTLPVRSSLDHHEEGFDEVDLSGTTGPGSARRESSFFGSNNAASRAATASPGTAKHSNFTQYLSSGLNAFMAPASPSVTAAGPTRDRADSLLLEDDDEMDEAAFARAQREEEMKKMVAHVREVKRGLTSKWKGWRLDLVESRKAGDGGLGEVFEV
ncbi:uncharacterized protein AB675_6920 [Cyphellophora attinorum]|uniref:M protein repeat protein n=1 Tax=Cyphellophora attinorum TaxID=1664694 RepID=A0A0N1P0R2_9EURO|nr:uncharacterized protein AB675_6920 [Phialophora attinorum]KPI43196.1 hypothetical protein AB675_6920 [Phialophora attinorum]